MPRVLKAFVWVIVFAACAGVGAFVAAHSNPFPPGVEDPGARPLSPTASPTTERWVGELVARSAHRLYVGGSCSTGWVGHLAFEVDPAGLVAGEGGARLRGRARCDFPTAQVQTRVVHLSVSGRWRQGDPRGVRLGSDRVAPNGSSDLGAFVPSLTDLRFEPTPGPTATAEVWVAKLDRSDGDRGSYSVVVRIFRIRCLTGCV